MSTIQPPPPPPPPPNTIVHITPNVPSLIVVKPTAELLQTPQASQIPASVLLAQANGRAAIETPLGQFTIETTVPLKQGQALLLQPAPLNATRADNFVLHVLEIAGKPATPSANPALPGNTTAPPLNPGGSTALPAPSATPLSLSAPSTLSLTAGSTATATLLNTSPVFTPSASGGFSVTHGLSPTSITVTAPITPEVIKGTGPLSSQSTPLPNTPSPSVTPPSTGSLIQGTGAGTGTNQSASPPVTGLHNPTAPGGAGTNQSAASSVTGLHNPIALGGAGTSQSAASSVTGLHNPVTPGGAGTSQSAASSVTGLHNPTALGGAGTSQSAPSSVQHVAGSQFSLTIQSVTPPRTGGGTPSLSPATPFLPGHMITGFAAQTSLLGHTVIQTPTATINLPTASPLPTGTEITFKVETAPQLPDTGRLSGPFLHRESLLAGRSWPNLDESVSIIEQTGPATARQLGDHVLPKLNVKFTSTALFFLSALRGGDVRAWLGDAASKVLEKGNPGLMKKLGEDFRALSTTDETGGTFVRTSDWRGTLLPLQTQDGIEQIRLYFRHFQEEETEDTEQERLTGSRFLIDVTLSNIGRLQLDGMVEKQNKRLDMIIRTSSPLPQMVRQEMADLFTAANDIVGMRGAMSFQASSNGFIDPLALADTGAAGPGIVV